MSVLRAHPFLASPLPSRSTGRRQWKPPKSNDMRRPKPTSRGVSSSVIRESQRRVLKPKKKPSPQRSSTEEETFTASAAGRPPSKVAVALGAGPKPTACGAVCQVAELTQPVEPVEASEQDLAPLCFPAVPPQPVEQPAESQLPADQYLAALADAGLGGGRRYEIKLEIKLSLKLKSTPRSQARDLRSSSSLGAILQSTWRLKYSNFVDKTYRAGGDRPHARRKA